MGPTHGSARSPRRTWISWTRARCAFTCFQRCRAEFPATPRKSPAKWETARNLWGERGENGLTPGSADFIAVPPKSFKKKLLKLSTFFSGPRRAKFIAFFRLLFGSLLPCRCFPHLGAPFGRFRALKLALAPSKTLILSLKKYHF